MASLTYKVPEQGIDEYKGPRPDVVIEIDHGRAEPAVQMLTPGENLRTADLMLLRLNDPGRSIGFGLMGINGLYLGSAPSTTVRTKAWRSCVPFGSRHPFVLIAPMAFQ